MKRQQTPTMCGSVSIRLPTKRRYWRRTLDPSSRGNFGDYAVDLVKLKGRFTKDGHQSSE
jgi:hypothetical protein